MTTRPDLVNLPKLTNPTDAQTVFVVQDSAVNQTLSADQVRQFIGNQIGPTGPQGPQGVQGPQGPQGVQGPQGPAFTAYSTSSATPASSGVITLTVSTSNHSFVTGVRVLAINSVTNFFEGVATVYNNGLTFDIAADFNIGSVTTNSWTISLTGQKGATGPQGPQGVQGPTGPSFKVTSTSTATPANVGNIVLVVNTSNHSFITGQRVIAINATNNFFEGIVTVTAGINFTIAADYNIGNTSANSWTVGLAGQKGATGPQGPQGVTGPTGPSLLVRSLSAVTPDGVSTSTMIVDTANHLFQQGMRVIAINTTNNFFEGTIINNVSGITTFQIKQDKYTGGTPAASWYIVLTGKEGPQGPAGPPGGQYAITATNIENGAIGNIPIQSGTGTTAFIASGNPGNLLQYTLGTATWVSTTTLRIGVATNADKIYANQYLTTNPTPSKYLGIVDYQGVAYSDIGIQAGLLYNTQEEKLTSKQIYVSSGTESTSTLGGALVVEGGAAIKKNLNVAGIASVLNNTNAISTTTGALIVQGGLGVGGNIFVGGEIIAQKLTIELTTITTTIVVTDDVIKTNNNSNAFSTITGALQIAGGAGIGKDLHVGGTVYAPVFSGAFSGVVTTATSIQYGQAGELVYQFGPNQTSFVSTSTSGYVLVSRGSSMPVWQNTLTLTGTATAVSTNSGALQVVGGVGIGKDLVVGGTIYGTVTTATFAFTATTATNLAGGLVGGLPYQVSPGQTTFLPIGSNATVLTSNGSTPSWTPLSGVSAGLAFTATNLQSGTAGQIPYQQSPGLTGFFGPGTAGDILVGDGTNAPKFQNTLTLSSTTNATSTLTGALQVRGGVGIGRDLVVGGTVYGTVLTATFAFSATTATFANLASVATLATSATFATSASTAISASSASFATSATYVTYTTNVNSGTAGQLVYQVATSQTGFVSTSTSGYVLVSRGSSAPIWQNTITLTGTDTSISTNSGAFQVIGGAGIGGDLYATRIRVVSTSNAISTLTGAVQVKGGVGIEQDLYVGGTIYGVVNGGGVASTVVVTATNSVTDHFITFVDSNNTTSSAENLYTTSSLAINPNLGSVKVLSTVNSTGTNSGGLQVTGGVGINQDLYVGGGTTLQGISTVTNTTNSTNTTSGALQVVGGVGIGRDLYVGGIIYGTVSGGGAASTVLVVANSSSTDHFITFVDSNNSSANTETFYTTSTLAIQPTSGNVKVLGTNNSTSSSTGALQISGGVGIHKDLFVGGSIIGTVTTSTHLKGGSAGVLVIQTATDRTGFAGPGTAGDVLVSAGTTSTGPVFQNTLTLAGITTASSTVTGALQVKGGVGIGGTVYLGGYLQVGTTTTTTGTNGEIRATNEITAYFGSDINLKENIRLIENPITLIEQIRGVYFDWRDFYIEQRGGEDGYFVRKHDVGVIAQEVESILPEIVAQRDDGYKAVKYEKLVPLLIESIKALNEEIKELKKRIQ